MIYQEHFLLLRGGVIIGAIAAVATVLPHALSTGDNPWIWVAYALVGLILSGIFWIWLASRVALRGRMIRAIRND